MPAGTFSSDIFGKCLPAISTDINRCGAVTLCDISPTTTDELANLYKDASGRWRVIGSLIEADFTGKACQIKRNGLYDLIAATRKAFGPRRLTVSQRRRDLIEVQPFLLMDRKGPINSDYWKVVSTGTTGTSPNSVSYDRHFSVDSIHGMPDDTRWFPVGIHVFVNSRTAGGTSVRTAWRVVDVEETGGSIKVYVKDLNAGSNLPSHRRTINNTDITTYNGVMFRGVPNVSAYEKYCAQIPGVNTKQKAPFWIQETRYTMCDNELYRRYINAIKAGNPYFEEFGDVEAVDLNRQITEDFQRRMVWSWFFGKPISASQTLAEWDNLETISAYSDDSAGNYLNFAFEGRCVGRRANAVGMYEQYAECGRIADLQGNVLNIPELQVALYDIVRVRKSNSVPTDVIELWTDSAYAPNLAQGFLRYFKERSEGLLRLNQELSAKVNQGPLGFMFQEFQMDYPGVKIRIVTHEAFDDLVGAHTTANSNLENSGRVIWIPDWTSMYQAIINSYSVTNSTGTAQEIAKVNSDFLCVAKVPKESQRIVGTAFTNVNECPQSGFWFENLSSGIPEHKNKYGTYTDYYGDDPAT